MLKEFKGLARNGNLVLGEMQALYLVPVIRRVIRLGDLIHRVEWGEELVIRPSEGFSYSSDVKAAHNIGP